VILLGIAIELWVRGNDDLHEVGDAVLQAFEDIRTPFLTDLAKAVAFLTSFTAVQVLRLSLAIVLVVTKRFRHLVVALATFVISDWLVLSFLDVQLPPGDVTPLIDETDFRFPSWPMTAFAITVFAMPFVLAPAGVRKRAMTGAWTAVVLVALSRLYLAADYPVNVVYAAVFSWVLTETLFRWFVPDESFPVSYRRGGNAAHLDLGGVRGEAVKRAMADQVGLEVTRVEPFRWLLATPYDPGRRVAGLRKDLRPEPRPGGSLVPLRPDDPIRQARGRGAVRLGAPARRVRGLRAALPRDERRDGRAHMGHRRAHAEQRVHARHGVLRGLEEPR
jgi:membrane-associated phospholipid phosphatase